MTGIIITILPGELDQLAGVERLAVLVGIAAGSYLLANWFVLRRLPPAELAPLVVQGRPVDEILEAIADRIHRLCRRFLIEVGGWPRDEDRWSRVRRGLRPSRRRRLPPDRRLLDRLLEAARGEIEASAELVCSAEARADELRSVRERHDLALRRIEALKHEASRELAISSRRFCDHVLQFSPSLFRQGFDKYLRNLREMIELVRIRERTGRLADIDVERFAALVAQSRQLEKHTLERTTIQEQLLRFRDLHDDVCSLASSRSTSGAIQAYARAISQLAVKQEKRLRESGLDDQEYRSRFVEIVDRFRFLYRRQRAHPGFDLHDLLSRWVENLDGAAFEEGAAEAQASLLKEMGSEKGQRLFIQPVAKSAHLRHDMMLKHLEAASAFHGFFNRAVGLSRREIADRFGRALRQWRESAPTDTTVYLVIGGYSKTVRDLLKGSCAELTGRDEGREARLRTFLLLGGDDEELAARKMVWDLRGAGSKETLRIAAGSEEMLLSLVRSGDRVLILLGAECVDSERRVVHPHTALPRMQHVLDDLRGREVVTLTIVAAEEYKCLPVPLGETPFLFRQFEKVYIYPPDLVDLVLTESRPEPAEIRAIVSGRTTAGREPGAGAGGCRPARLSCAPNPPSRAGRPADPEERRGGGC